MEWISVKNKEIPKDGKEYLACNMRQTGVKALIGWNAVHKHYQIKGEPEIYPQWTHWTEILPDPPKE